MDYRKVDASLAQAIEHPTRSAGRLPVFLRTRAPLPEDAVKELQQLGVPKPGPGEAILTAELSLSAVAALSDRPWVISIRSGRRLRPGEDQ